MSTGLLFDEKEHRYFLDGRELPSITRILRDVGIGDLDEADPMIAYAAERGRAIHEATALDDQGQLDEASVDPVVRRYLDAWRLFRKESGFRAEEGLIEQPLASSSHGFAGTPDRGGWLGNDEVVLEIKATSELPLRIGLQLAAQQLLLWCQKFAVLRRFAVQLRPDGSYRLQEFKDPEDRNVFLAALRVFQWKQKEADDGSQG